MSEEKLNEAPVWEENEVVEDAVEEVDTTETPAEVEAAADAAEEAVEEVEGEVIPEKKKLNIMAIIALVGGILSVFPCCFLLWPVGIFVNHLTSRLSKDKETGEKPLMAKIGKICSFVGFGLCVLLALIVIAVVGVIVYFAVA